MENVHDKTGTTGEAPEDGRSHNFDLLAEEEQEEQLLGFLRELSGEDKPLDQLIGMQWNEEEATFQNLECELDKHTCEERFLYNTDSHPNLEVQTRSSDRAKRDRPDCLDHQQERAQDPLSKREKKTVEVVNASPPLTYPELIALAIINSPGQTTAVKDIYKIIMTVFPWFRATNIEWRSCIRHALWEHKKKRHVFEKNSGNPAQYSIKSNMLIEVLRSLSKKLEKEREKIVLMSSIKEDIDLFFKGEIIF